MQKNIGIGTNKKIIEIYNMMREGTLILKPSFQRNLVWNNKHKEHFIETILLGYPFPELYFADGEIDLVMQKSQTLVVDGQQRLNTIYEYITDSPKLILKKVKRFPELTNEEQRAFFDYPVVVRDLGRLDMKQIKEIFNRINSVQYALNAMEINNALYEGEFISTAKEIIDTGYLNDLNIFGESEASRMIDLQYIVLIMTTIEIGGYFTSDNEVEELIKLYDDEYPNKELMKDDLITALRIIKNLNLPVDSIWYRKSSLFSLIVELVFVKRRKGHFPEEEKLRETLIKLEERILKNKGKNKSENKYARFYNYIYQSTASRSGRIARGELLEEYLNSLF
ncbi:hypothetical protein BO219_04410 [Anoxybacillus kestanbolensis]|uniref:GmrSD restriction endonucleases N-terminal domain-containing protein n=1 Tax=Anoxybacillus kestanbolensis TaxID=227476 RepID=A0A1V3FSG6_9BACL|nr:DUF262 domain-containing protein [Anoxybacillus kestanbolensis]OOE04643.1 hypothetical protein BO219_04410 [Anoxybacillus kestanbolensis]